MEMRFFKPSEFTQKGLVVFDKMDADFLALLDECRRRAGVPFVITSSYRDPEHNARVGGAPSSWHLKGRAVDVDCVNIRARARIIKAALEVGLTVGIMQYALHLDNRNVDFPVVFDYYAKYRRTSGTELA
jgi:uncharacterized protein YcbK (DUF882 family)